MCIRDRPYAVAKIAGIKMCEAYNKQYKTNYKCLMPANTYGPNDTYDLMNSHFFPALIHKAHLCKSNNTNFKGIGQPLRIALTGSKFGPGIYDIIISLDKEEVIKRLTDKKLS